MPNTLVHVAVHFGIFGRSGIPIVAIIAGCIVPDLPWILNRAIGGLGLLEASPLNYAYFVAQASLVVCCIGCLLIGVFFERWLTTTIYGAVGCLLHLVLDSLQDKWGNGVHLFAPVDWTLLQIGVIPIESGVIVLISFLGLLPFMLLYRKGFEENRLEFSKARGIAVMTIVVLYATVPYLFIDDVLQSDSRYLGTLSEQENRTGKLIEFDREVVFLSSSGVHINTPSGERLELVDVPSSVDDGIYSVRGIFESGNRLRVQEWKRHSGARDLASIIGLTLIFLWFARGISKHIKGRVG